MKPVAFSVDEDDFVVNPSLHVAVVVTVRSKSGGAVQVALDPATEPDAEVSAALLAIASSAVGSIELSLTHAAEEQLRRLSVLICRADVPEEAWFECVPGDALAHQSRAVKSSFPSDSLLISAARSAAEVPPRWRDSTLTRRLRPGVSIFCALAENGILQPFWLDESEAVELARISEHRAEPGNPQALMRLISAGIVVTEASFREQTQLWNRMLAAARQELAQTQCCALRPLLPAALVGALRRYAESLSEGGEFVSSEDIETTMHRTVCNEPTFRLLQDELADCVSTIVGSTVRSTRCYLIAYRPFSRLPRHRDRIPSSWNLSLVVRDTAADSREQSDPWPICIETTSGVNEVRLAEGEAVLYDGHTFYHWRDALDAERHVVIALFHFDGDARLSRDSDQV